MRSALEVECLRIFAAGFGKDIGIQRPCVVLFVSLASFVSGAFECGRRTERTLFAQLGEIDRFTLLCVYVAMVTGNYVRDYFTLLKGVVCELLWERQKLDSDNRPRTNYRLTTLHAKSR